MFRFEKQLLWLLKTFLNDPSLCSIVLAILCSFNRKRDNKYEWNESDAIAKLKRFGVLFLLFPHKYSTSVFYAA